MVGLGKKHTCSKCHNKFYDLGDPDTQCPICTRSTSTSRIKPPPKAVLGAKADSIRDLHLVIKWSEEGFLPEEAMEWARSACETLEDIWDAADNYKRLTPAQGVAIRNIHKAARKWLEHAIRSKPNLYTNPSSRGERKSRTEKSGDDGVFALSRIRELKAQTNLSLNQIFVKLTAEGVSKEIAKSAFDIYLSERNRYKK